MPHLRFGELLIGSIFAIFVQKKRQQDAPLSQKSKHLWVGSASVLALLLCLVLPFPRQTPLFPGIMAVIPCVASVGLIYCGEEKSNIISKVLSLSSVVFIGKLSYSLYLWHWVVLSFARYILVIEMTTWQLLACVPLMFMLAYASYKFVEQPLRYKNWNFKTTFLFYYVVPSAMCLLLLMGWKIQENKKDYFTFGSPKYTASQIEYLPIINNNKPTKVLIAGDSYTTHLVGFVEEVSKHENWNGVLSGLYGTIFLFDYMPKSFFERDKGALHTAIERKEKIMKHFSEFDTIILSNLWSRFMGDKNFINELIKVINSLEKQGKKVILIHSCDIYAFSRMQETYWNLSGWGNFKDTRFSIDQLRTNVYYTERAKNNAVRDAITRSCPNTKWVDLTQYIPDRLMIDGKSVLFNKNHFSYWGAKEIAKRFIKDGKTLVENKK